MLRSVWVGFKRVFRAGDAPASTPGVQGAAAGAFESPEPARKRPRGRPRKAPAAPSNPHEADIEAAESLEFASPATGAVRFQVPSTAQKMLAMITDFKWGWRRQAPGSERIAQTACRRVAFDAGNVKPRSARSFTAWVQQSDGGHEILRRKNCGHHPSAAARYGHNAVLSGFVVPARREDGRQDELGGDGSLDPRHVEEGARRRACKQMDPVIEQRARALNRFE